MLNDTGEENDNKLQKIQKLLIESKQKFSDKQKKNNSEQVLSFFTRLIHIDFSVLCVSSLIDFGVTLSLWLVFLQIIAVSIRFFVFS